MTRSIESCIQPISKNTTSISMPLPGLQRNRVGARRIAATASTRGNAANRSRYGSFVLVH